MADDVIDDDLLGALIPARNFAAYIDHHIFEDIDQRLHKNGANQGCTDRCAPSWFPSFGFPQGPVSTGNS
ncbi:hypothetical protein [Sphingomonas parapaucimobilis]|uniref:hypothetical protein n=1 Tax=Sphingomonas parapaucimobilis TaxID=28213 RepID=UPI0012EDE807|nr:hypothetical protein [Sphingomonas parapaucimobilis]